MRAATAQCARAHRTDGDHEKGEHGKRVAAPGEPARASASKPFIIGAIVSPPFILSPRSIPSAQHVLVVSILQSIFLYRATSVSKLTKRAVKTSPSYNSDSGAALAGGKETELLRQENQVLKDRAKKDWFLAGAGVMLIGIVMGLLVSRVRLRRSSWGDTL